MTSLVSDISKLQDRDLLGKLYNSYKKYITENSADPKIKQEFHALYKELLHRLVTPNKSEQLSVLLDSKDFAESNMQFKTWLHEELTKSFSEMHQVLFNAIDNLANKAMKEYCKLRAEGRMSDVHSYASFPVETKLSEALKQGAAHDILLIDNKFVVENPNIDIFSSAVQVFGLSQLKKPLLIKEDQSNLSWQDYKDKTCAAITMVGELDSQELRSEQGSTNVLAEIMSKNSPFLLAFQNAVNSVCEALTLEAPFTTAKRTQELRQALKNITTTVKIDNPLEEEKSEDKSLRT